MNRRDLLARLNPLRAVARTQTQEAGKTRRETQDALFRLAMARGIDPATVDPEQLAELLGLTPGGPGMTGRR